MPAVGAAISSVGGGASTVVESSLSRTILGISGGCAGCDGRASVGGADTAGCGPRPRVNGTVSDSM